MLSITRIFTFEAAHAILNYNGPCKNSHGHSYELHVTVSGLSNPESQMIMDFKELKHLVQEVFLNQADHALFINQTHPNALFLEKYEGKVYPLNHEPTAENLIQHIADKFSDKLPSGVELARLRLYETATSYAEWER